MDISVATIQAPPPPTPAPPSSGSTNSTDAANNRGFSQELSRAKSKGGQAAGQQAPQTQTNVTTANADAKKASSNSAGDKGKSKQQKKSDQTGGAKDEAKDAAAETQHEVTDTVDVEAANVAEDAQKKPIVIQPKVAKTAPAEVSPTGKVSKSDSGASKAVNPDPNKSAHPSADLSTLQAVAAAPQTAAANAKTAATDATNTTNTPDNSGELKQPASAKPIVSPFKAENAAQNSKEATAQKAVDAAGQAEQAPTKVKTVEDNSGSSVFARALEQAGSRTPAPSSGVQHAAPAAVPQTPVAQFAAANQPAIVSTIRGSLLPDGGTMNITLNPPDLGAMQISVRMENGVMSASFQTSNDQATRLLTHTLGQLKDALEIQGVSVDRLHVHQASSSESSSNSKGDSESGGKQSSQDGRSAQQEEQRRETLRRMWRRARGQRDPLDLVA